MRFRTAVAAESAIQSEGGGGGGGLVMKGETKEMRIVCMDRRAKNEYKNGERGGSLLAAQGSPPRLLPPCSEMLGCFLNTPPGWVQTLTHRSPKPAAAHLSDLTDHQWPIDHRLVTTVKQTPRLRCSVHRYPKTLGFAVSILQMQGLP